MIDNLVSPEVLAGLLVGFAVLTVGLVVLQIWSSLQIRRMSKTTYQDDVREAQSQAADIVTQAQIEAQEVLTEANEAGAQAMADASRVAKKTNESYQAELRGIIDRYHQLLDETIKRGDQSFTTLTKAAADSFNRRQDELNEEFDDVLGSLSTVGKTLTTKTTQSMTDLETGIDKATSTLAAMMEQGEEMVKQHMEEHLNKLLDRAEADVEEYRKARLTLLDNHIERLVEDITVRVLHKKLTLDEHGELALQALKDAKENNVL